MDMDMVKSLNLLDQLENRMEKLYEHFSRVFASDEEAAELFRRMKNDEFSHSNIIQFELRMVMSNRAEFGELDLDVKAIREMLAQADAFLASVPAPSLEAAFKIALELESAESKLSYLNHIATGKPKLARLLSQIVKFDRGHYLQLRDFAAKRRLPLPPEAPEPKELKLSPRIK